MLVTSLLLERCRRLTVGGDQGGFAEEPTRLKPFSRRALLLEGKPVGSDQYVVEEVSSSNWHPPAREGLGVDEEELLVGEVDMEDDAFIEEEPDKAPTPPPVPWRLMARYVGQIAPSAETLKVHFTKVWMLRRGATFAPIKPKWFIITLNSEGDYNFVVNGGPWVHLGNSFLVQPLKGDERPSATDLTSMPIWVKMYDVPWDKQNEANGSKWGSRLGRVVEVDADKSTYRDFLRVHIEIPINKRLQTHITTGVKDRPETHSTYILRYERVPYFCFWCGFIGHNDTVCEKKRRGMPSLGYDSNLRCSPMRKYEYRQAHAPPWYIQWLRRVLIFHRVDNSETLGVPKVRTRRQVPRQGEDVVPVAIDAHDGFESTEKGGDQGEERDLAVLLHALRVQFPDESLTSIRERLWKQKEMNADRMMVVVSDKVEGSEACAPTAVFVEPLAMLKGPFPPSSSDMIHVLRGLSSWVASEDTADTKMTEVNSILGKRMASHAEEEEVSVDEKRALIVHVKNEHGSIQKKGRGCQMEREDVSEATSPGAAGQLTGTHGAPRQQQ
ncbi:hypothetical protein ACQ4PT_049959 [Festuca glaucescens]